MSLPSCNHRLATNRISVLAMSLVLCLHFACLGANVSWDDEGVSNLWSDIANWNPTGVPQGGDDVFIGNLAGAVGDTVFLDLNIAGAGANLDSLTMSQNTTLVTNGFEIIINTNAGTTLDDATIQVDPHSGSGDSLDTNTLTLNDGALIDMNGGILEVDNGLLDINNGAVVSGFGVIDLEDSVTGPTKLLENDGILRAAVAFGDITGTETLQINVFDVDGRIDLDGSTNNNAVEITQGAHLDINGQLNDGFSGSMTMGPNTQLSMSHAWSVDGAATIDVDAFNQLASVPDVATISGANMQMGGNSSINVSSGSLVMENDLSATNNAQINVGGQGSTATIQFDGTTTINGGATLNMSGAGTGTANLRVNGNLTVQQPTIDWDADGTNTTTIGSGGALTLDVDMIDTSSDSFDSTIVMNGGQLHVHNLANQWTMNDTLNLNDGGGNNNVISGTAAVVIGSSGTVNVSGGATSVNVPFTLNPSASLNLSGTGDLDLTANTRFESGSSISVADSGNRLNLRAPTTTWAGPSSVIGDGVIRQFGNGTFTDDTTIDVAIFDLDGDESAPSLVNVNSGNDVTINANQIDMTGSEYNGHMTINSSTMRINTPGAWTVGDGGTVTLFQSAGNPSPSLSGSQVVVESGGEIEVNGISTLMTAPLVLRDTGGAVPGQMRLSTNGSIIDINRPLTLDGGDIVQDFALGTVRQNVELTVTGDSTVAVDVYDWDGGGAAETTVENGGVLHLDVNRVDAINDRFDGTINLNDGRMQINVAASEWQMDGTLNLNSSATDSVIIGAFTDDTMRIGDGATSTSTADVNVTGAGRTRVNVPVVYDSDARVNIAAGSELAHVGPVELGGEFTGDGTLTVGRFGGATTTGLPTTINMPGGTVELDGGDNLSTNTVTITNSVDIIANQMASFGGFAAQDRLIIDRSAGGSLTVNDSDGEWSLASQGRMDWIGDGTVPTVLYGSRLNVNGTVNVSSKVLVASKLDVVGTINVPNAGDELRLFGGIFGDVEGTHRMEGGTITGNGTLSDFPFSPSEGLYGFGTIDVNVDFADELKADDGVLMISGNLANAGFFGTADSDGILDVTNPWNTNVATAVQLAGGELRGAAITNDAMIQGHGLVSAQVINNGTIQSANGTLVVNNASNSNDWDGTTNNGTVSAGLGDLTLVDVGTHSFAGTMTASNGSRLALQGFGFDFTPGSSLQLNNGELAPTHATNIGGTVSVTTLGAIDTSSSLRFESTSATTLNGDLRVANSPTVVEAGASFSGSGSLINVSGELLLEDAANIGVTVENQGLLTIGSSPGRADVNDLVQTSSATLEIELAGTGLGDFDRLITSGGAQLAGTLDVSLLGGFTPSLGDSFQFLTAVGGVLGTFDTELLPVLGGNLEFDVIYNANNVLLSVIDTMPFEPTDFDMDGVIDGADVDALVAAIVAMTNDGAFDLTGDGMVNGDDLDQWLTDAGAINNPSGGAYLLGDANLDGIVDGQDFVDWNSNKFTATPAWTAGDFTADGFVDGQDFVAWNSNKFMSSDATGFSPVPEPTTSPLLLLLLGLVGVGTSRRPIS